MNDIALKKYVTLTDTSEYDNVLHFLKPKNIFLGKKMDVQSMMYINVKYCFKLLPTVNKWEDICELFNLCFGVDNEDFWNASIVEFYSARNFLIEELKKTAENEIKLLSGNQKDSDKWKRAGVNRLDKFSDMISLDRLGQRYGMYPPDLGRKPYSEIIYLSAMIKTDNEINTAFSEIK